MAILAMWFVLSCVNAAPRAQRPDWWIMLKYPASIEYDYADSNYTELSKADGDLDSEDGPLKEVLEAYYASKSRNGTGWIVWNDAALKDPNDVTFDDSDGYGMLNEDTTDEDDDTFLSARPRCVVAHSKGVLFFDAHGGTLLTHSIPRFPNKGMHYKGYPTRSTKYAQHFMRANLNSTGVHLFMTLVVLHLWPSIRDKGMNDDANKTLAHLYPMLTKLISGGKRQRFPWLKYGEIMHTHLELGAVETVESDTRASLRKSGRTTMTVVTKPCGNVTSIFEYIASDVVKSTILAETWIRGQKVHSSSSVHNVVRVCGNNKTRSTSTKPTPRIWKSTRDHSKYFVTLGAKNGYVGVGDLNRMLSQWKRGGSFFILNNYDLARSFRARIDQYENDEEVIQSINDMDQSRDNALAPPMDSSPLVGEELELNQEVWSMLNAVDDARTPQDTRTAPDYEVSFI
eukprot:GEMP01042375.1.p1 GENE.GEMP01042375.1~~GEMP01042375.1.p1  ORF type:complete len:456 (+),score=98.78 GEMP01042375.1:52-1419(+)